MRLICPPHISLILLQLLATCVFSSKPQRHNSYWGSHYPGTPGAGITGRSAVRNPLSPADAYQNSTRVALYLAGQTRTLNRTICSMRQHLIAPLRAQGLAVHIFAVVEADATANAAELLQSLGAAAVHVRLVDPAAVPVPERCMELVTRGFNKGVFRAYGGGYAREYLRKMYYRQQCDEWRQVTRAFRIGGHEWGLRVVSWIIRDSCCLSYCDSDRELCRVRADVFMGPVISLPAFGIVLIATRVVS